MFNDIINSVKGKGILGSGQNVSSVSAYQQNLYTPTQKEPEKKTLRSTLGQLSSLSKTNKEEASKGVSLFGELIHDPTSSYYRPYTAPTNNAVNILKDYGIDVDSLTDEWFEQNRGSINANLIYSGTSNTPTKPGKKATKEQNISYWLYQYEKSESDTKKAEKEREAAFEEASYWTRRKDLNLSDDEIINNYVRKDFASKYPTLAKMENKSSSEPVELNRAVDFSDDYLYASIWQARNPDFQGDVYQAMANSYNGEGNTWKYNEEIAKKLDPDSPEFNPYAVSAVGVDDVCVYYGVDSLDDNFLAQHQADAFSNDETRKKMYSKALQAVQNADAAEKAVAALDARIEERLGNYTDYNRAKAKLDSWLEDGIVKVNGVETDIKILNKMDASIGKGDELATGNMVMTGRAVNYKYSDVLARIKEMCDRNLANQTNADDNLAEQTDPTPLNEVQESAEEQLQTGTATVTPKATPGPTTTPGPVDPTEPAESPLAERENEVAAGKVREQTVEEKNNAMMTQKVINVTESVYDRLTEPERKQFGLLPIVNGQKLVDGYRAVMEGNTVGPINKDLLTDPEWLGKMATKQSVKAEEAYMAKSLESLALRTVFDEKAESIKEKNEQIQALDKQYGEQLLAAEDIPEEKEITLDNGFTIYFEMNSDGVYEPVMQNLDSPFVANYLSSIGMGIEDYIPVIEDQTRKLNEHTEQVRAAKQKYPSFTEEETEGLAKVQKQIDVLKAQAAYEQEYIDEHQEEYDDAMDVMGEAAERRDRIGAITLKDSGFAIDKTISDDVLHYIGAFTNYEAPSDEPESVTDQLYAKYGTSEEAVKDIKDIVDNIDQQIANIDYVMMRYQDLPDLYKQKMGEYLEYLNKEKRLHESYLVTLNSNYDDLVQKGIEYYGNDRTQAVEMGVAAEDQSKTGMAAMNEQERNLYYAMYALYGVEAADQYYRDIEGSLVARVKEGIQEGAQESAQSGFLGRVFNELVSISAAPFDVIESVLYMAGTLATGKGDPWLRIISHTGKAASTEVINAVNETYKDKPVLKTLVSGFYEIVNNRGRSALTGGAFGGFVPGTNEIIHAMPIATTAAAETLEKALNNNVGVAEAWGLATVAFLSESLTEGIELGNMKNAMAAGSLSAWKDFWKDRIPAGLSEMLGETLNDAIENEFDALLAGDNSDRQKAIQEYVDAGYMPDDARAMAIADELKGLIHTAAISFISPTMDIGMFAYGKLNSTLYYAKQVDKLRRIGDATTTVRDLKNRDLKYFKAQQELEERALSRELKPFFSDEKKAAETETETKAEEAPVLKPRKERIRFIEEGPIEEAAPAAETPAERAAREKTLEGVRGITPEGIALPEAILVPTGAEEENDIRSSAATVVLDTAMDSEDSSTQILAIATVLKMTQDADSTVGMGAATELAGRLGARNALIAVNHLMTRAGALGVDVDLVRSGLRYAMVEGSQSRQMMDSTSYKKASWNDRTMMISEAATQDMKSAKTDISMQEANHRFRVGEAAKQVIAQGDAQERLDAADQKAADAQRKKNEATQRLQSQQDVEQAKADAVKAAAEEAAQNPSKQNTDRLTHAVNDLDSQSKVTDEYRQSETNAQQENETAQAEAEKTRDQVITEVRDQAEQMVAEEDRARAEQQAEQEQLIRVRKEEEEKRQQEEDERTGKAQEERENTAIAETVAKEGLEPAEAADKIEKATENRDKVKESLRDLSKPVSDAEGYIALGAFQRKLGIEIRLEDLGPITDKGWTRGKYVSNPETGETYIVLNKNMKLGQALVEAALHEITHSMKNTGAYEAYRGVALKSTFEDAEKGYSMTGDSKTDYENNPLYRAKIDATIQEREEANDPNFVGKTKAEQIAAAEEEIVADFARLKLAEKDVIQRMMDSGTAGKIRNALHNINQMLKNYFGNLTGEERKQAEYLRRAERLYQKAMDQAAKNSEHPEGSQFSIMQIAQATNMTFDEKTLKLYDRDGNEIDGVKRKITADMIKNTPVGLLIDHGLTGEQNIKAKEMMAGLMNMVARYKDSDLIWEIGATTLSSTFSALKSNSDPQYKTTVDFGTVCAKTQAIIDTLSKVMLDRVAEGKYGGLTRQDIMKVYDAVNQAGLSVPCPVCYVFSRWMGVPSLLGQMSQYQHDYVVLDENGKIDKQATQAKVDEYIRNAEDKYGTAKAINNQKTKIQNKLTKLEEKRVTLEKEMYGLKTAEEKAAKQAEIDSVMDQMTELDKQLGEVSAYNWVTQALCKKQNGKYVVDEKFKYTPDEILFDLNRTGEFAGYAKNWKYRNTRGAGMGKAIMPYSGETIGDILFGVKKQGRQSTIKNPWLNMDDKAAQKQLREAQLRAIKQNLVGGQRLQSTSDFRPEWGLDYIMSFLELQAAGSKVQMYTKVAEAIDFFASVGADVNLSIMGKGQGYHEATAEEIAQMSDEEKQAATVDGKVYVMDFSPVTGMDYSTARDYKNKYNNVQMILVGMNDTHIRLAMANKDIDFIIPWHSSGNSKDVISGLMSTFKEKLENGHNYEDSQTDKVSKTQTAEQKALWDARLKLLTKGGKALTEQERRILLDNDYTRELYKRFTTPKGEKGYDPDCYGVKLSKEQANQIFPYEYWNTSLTKDKADENGRRFVEYCESMGLVPRFSQFKDDKGYWKLLIDRPMYNNDGTYHQQQVIDVTKAQIGNLDDSGKLENSDLPTQAQAKYAPKDPRNANYAKYTAAQKQAIENAEAAIDTQYHDGSEEKRSVFGDMTLADRRVLRETERDYKSAVKRGDMDAAQKDVDYYAQSKGYTLEVFHGTGETFNRFNLGNEGIHLGNYEQAEHVADQRYELRSSRTEYKWNDIRDSVSEMTDEQRQSLLDGTYAMSHHMSYDIPQFTGDISDADAVVRYVDDVAQKYEDDTWMDLKIRMDTFDRKVGRNILSLYAKINNPFVIDGDITVWSPENIASVLLDRDKGITEQKGYNRTVNISGSDIALTDQQKRTLEQISSMTKDEQWEAISDVLEQNGYDGIKYLNEYEGDRNSYSYIATRASDVKRADPVTYDDQGKVIPLSERFNEGSEDIRYSKTGDDLTDADLAVLKKSKAVTQEEIDAYRQKTSRPLEGKNARWSSEEGPAERQFGGEDGMLSESDEIAQTVIDYVRKNNKYFPDTNEAQILRAVNWIRKNGTHKDEKGNVTHTDGYQESIAKVTGKSFDYRSADGQARMIATMAMAVAKNDVTAQVALVDAYNRQGTDLGRALQARKMFSMMTPAGRIASLQKLMDSLQEELQLKGDKTVLTLSDWIYQAAAAAQTEEDFDVVQNAANAELATQLPVNWKDKINSLRMLSMLMNPRTHIRNILGNMFFVPAVGIRNKLAAVAELAVKKGNKTKTLSPILSKEARAFARTDALAMKDTLRGEAKYNDKSKIKMQQKVFGQGNGVLSKTLGKFTQALIDMNGGALEGEDWFFLRGHYRKALGGWMMANGYTADQLESNPELLEKGRQYAVEEAQKATYRDYNELANKLNDLVRDPKTIWGKAGAFTVNAVLPFKKTPANILRRGLEYSPIGIVKSISSDLYHLKQYQDYQKGKLSVMPEGALSPTQVISNFCSGLTGTGIMALGMILSHAGVVKCSMKDKEDEFDKLEGSQEYSLEISIGGMDVSFTMDWAAPMCMPFFVGAAIDDIKQDEEGYDVWDYANAVFNIAEPITQLSMLDGLNSVFRTSQSEDTDTITQIFGKIASNYVTSFAPSLLGAIARSYDPIRRKSYVKTGEGSGIEGTVKYATEQVENKIPGVSQSNIPVRDAFGRVEESSLTERIIENFVSPGYFSAKKKDPVVEELRSIYKETGDPSMIPKLPQKYFKAGGEQINLDAEQYDQLTVERGQTAYNLISELQQNKYYQQVSAQDKASMINDVWTYATENAKYNINPKANVEGWALNSRTNPVHGIVNRNKDKVRKECIEGYKVGALQAVRDNDSEAFWTCIEALEEMNVNKPEKSVKDYVTSAYKAEYIRAYQDNDQPKINEIEDLLTSSELDFSDEDFEKWIEDSEKQVAEEEDED